MEKITKQGVITNSTLLIILVRKNKTFVIAGKKGSTAQTYAKKNGFRFLNNTAAVRTAKMTGVPKTKTILRGKTYTIQAVTVPYYSDEKILFRSSDRRIATVNSKGVVTGKGNPKRDGRDHRAERSEKTEL